MIFPPRFNMAHYFLDHNLEAGRGDKIAVQWVGGSKTYAEVVEDANRFAHALGDMGHRMEERVLFLLPDRYEFIPAWFGTLKAGGVFTMVNPHLPASDYTHYLEYTRARVAIVDSDCFRRIRPILEQARHLLAVVVVGDLPERVSFGPGGPEVYEFASLLRDSENGFIMAETSPDDIAGWLFTSGSTGKPKGAVHRHRDFAFNTEYYAKQVLGITEDDITLGVPKLFFGYATGTNLMFPFAVGAQTVIFPGRSTPDTLLDHIEAFKPTILTSVPTMINLMERHSRAEGFDFSSLRMVLSAGEALPAELFDRWMARTGAEILDGIGSAEMFHIYISNYPGDARPGTLGKLVPGYSARIVNEEGDEVETGEVGRLEITGGSTAIMYWNNRESSVETFLGETCSTADYFRQDDAGYFYYEGRATDLLKVGGIWVSPLEVEGCILRHPAVGEVAVVGCEDDGGLVKPLAFVVCREGIVGDDALGEGITSFARSALAYYKYPRWVRFVESLPKNDRGKLDRKVVRTWV